MNQPIPSPLDATQTPTPQWMGKLFRFGLFVAGLSICLVGANALHDAGADTRAVIEVIVGTAGFAAALTLAPHETVEQAQARETRRTHRVRHQGLVDKDEAVSPVIGVILMVAITVILAAVVFVFVQNLSHTQAQAPQVTFAKDDNAHSLQVITADTSASWSDVVATISTGCNYSLNHGTATNAHARMAPTPTPIVAGDVVAITGPIAGSCTLTLSHAPSNTLMGTWSWVM